MRGRLVVVDDVGTGHHVSVGDVVRIRVRRAPVVAV
jgi:hypothetical protein